MLSAVGCRWVIVGHSERRQYFHETDETVLKKTQSALAAGLTPIVCVGERLEERESGATESVLRTQCAGGIAGLTPEEFARIVIAYEPVWAIGTGKTATPEIAAHAHGVLRAELAIHFGEAAAVVPYLIRRKRQTRQRERPNGTRRHRRRPGRRSQPRPSVLRRHRQLLTTASAAALRSKNNPAPS